MRALLVESITGVTAAAVAAGSFLWMVQYTVLAESDMIVIAAVIWLVVLFKLFKLKNTVRR